MGQDRSGPQASCTCDKSHSCVSTAMFLRRDSKYSPDFFALVQCCGVDIEMNQSQAAKYKRLNYLLR